MKPITLRAPEVRAALDTGVVEIVRAVKPAPKFEENPTLCEDGIWRGRRRYWCGDPDDPDVGVDVEECGPCPYGKPGERRWVRETWCGQVDPRTGCVEFNEDGNTFPVFYRASNPELEFVDDDGFMTDKSYWRSPVTMPRWASRLMLEITDVRVWQDDSEWVWVITARRVQG